MAWPAYCLRTRLRLLAWRLDLAPGVLPAWNWVPIEGAKPRLDVVPWWVRVWYELPLIDRYAHAWMWSHGGSEVRPP
jgi:hypothetical protein